jgi:hypothetical protein
MASPRKRLSLSTASFGKPNVLSPTSSHGGGFSHVAPLAAKAMRKAAGKQWPYAPRSARYSLVEAREGCGSTPAQFAQAISALSSAEGASVNQQQLLAMEAGFALVPSSIYSSAERLLEEHQAELARQQAATPPALAAGGEYPYQEPMEGGDYQIAPSRYLGAMGGTKAMSRENRKDELVFSPPNAVAAGVEIDEYLTRVRSLLSKPEVNLTFSEEVALSVLHDLGYDAKATIAALEMCVLWQQPPPRKGEEADTSSVAPRATALNSILWLQRLRKSAQRGAWSDGQREALDAGVAEHGKELAVMHRAHVLREKSLPELIEMYYVVGWRHQSP